MKKSAILSLILLISFVAEMAMAAEGGHGHGHGEIPTKTIIYQTINVGILFIALIYFLRKPIVDYFAERRTTFVKAAEKSQELRRAAEEKNRDIRARLSEISTTREQSIERAKAEAADLRKQMIAEAETLSQRIRREAQESARLELEKAKASLREMIVKESVTAARQALTSKVSTDDHQRLQGDFINNIQTVQR